MLRGVKLDEDLSPLVAEPLIEHGYDVKTVVNQGWSGMKDEQLWPQVTSEQRMFITADLGFSDIRHYRPGTHHGLVVLRAERESILNFRVLMAMLVAAHRLDDLEGALTVVSPRGIRIRRPA